MAFKSISMYIVTVKNTETEKKEIDKVLNQKSVNFNTKALAEEFVKNAKYLFNIECEIEKIVKKVDMSKL